MHSQVRRWHVIVFAAFIALSTSPVLATGSAAAGLPDCSSYSGVLPVRCGPPLPAADPAWVTAKNEHRTAWQGGNLVITSTPEVSPRTLTAVTLPTTVTGSFLEMRASGYDEASTPVAYTDDYFNDYCGPGAAAVTLQYWHDRVGTTTNPSTAAAGSFATHWTPSTLYWRPDGHARSYINYLAVVVRGGMMTFSTYPKAGSSVSAQLADLNYEASGHTQTGWPFLYRGTYTDSVQFHADVTDDINLGYPVIAFVKTADLTNWHWAADHSLAVIGYNDINRTYTYIDTATVDAGMNSNGGVFSMDQTAFFKAVQDEQLGWLW